MNPARSDPARTSDCAELSAKFAEAGWAPSDENFEERPFVKWHGSFFSVAGTPPGGDPCAKACKTAEEVLAFLAEKSELAIIARLPLNAEALNRATEQALVQDAAKPDDVELFPKPRPDPMGDALERQRIANARLLHKDDDLNPQAPSDWDMEGQGVVAEAVVEAQSEVEPMPDVLRDTLARLVEPDANEAAKKQALMTRWINLKAQMEDKKLPERDRKLPPISLAEIAEFEQLERYMGWFK